MVSGPLAAYHFNSWVVAAYDVVMGKSSQVRVSGADTCAPVLVNYGTSVAGKLNTWKNGIQIPKLGTMSELKTIVKKPLQLTQGTLRCAWA